jgi:class 3 adenylate cyclase/tetratricopeptide (TPR) repeat protein
VAVAPLPLEADALQPFVPRLAVDWVRMTPDVLWREVEGSLTFVDISGFTAMTERLARKGKVGAEEMNDVLNALFTELLGVAYRDGAGLVKWGGDAVLLLYEGSDHAARAARAAMEMQRTIRHAGLVHTSAGQARLRMSVGIHSGVFNFYLVGDPQIHRELVIAGPGGTRTTQMEQIAEAGEVVVSPEAVAQLDPRVVGIAKDEGFLLCGIPDPPFLEAPRPDSNGIDLASFIPIAIRGPLVCDELEAEHRRIVPSFIEFLGSDAMLERDGPAAVGAAIDESVRVVQAAAQRNGVSFFETDIGRNAWRVFLIAGAPKTAGQDEDRMLATVREIFDTTLPFPVRAGVNAGPVFAAYFGPPFRKTYSVKGDAVNLAARLMAKAGPGQIFATRQVLDPATSRYELKALEPFHVKGKKVEIHAFELGSRIGVTTDDTELPLVGREDELRAVDEAIARARAGTGGVVELVGPPGIGKSRMMAEVRARLDGFRQLSSFSEPYHVSTAYRAVRAILRAVLDIPRSMPDDEAGRWLKDTVLRVAPELEAWVPLLAVPIGAEVPQTQAVAELDERFRKAKTEVAVVQLLAALLPTATAFLLEDAHWMDEVSSDLVKVLIEQARTMPWLVCATRRIEPSVSFVDDPDVGARVLLGPIALDAAAHALVEATDDDPLRPDEVAMIAERSDGNPLFLRELLQAYRARGVADLPTTVEALVTEEIDALPPLERRILRDAAVLGTVFERGLLAALAGEDAVSRAHWSRLDRFVEQEATDRWRFRHALMRDAAYERLPYAQRRQLHALAGEAILQQVSDSDEFAELLSMHFFAADRMGEAWAYSRMAADRAATRYANADALRFYRRAIDAGRQVGVEPLELSSLHEAIGDVAWRMGAFRDAAAAYAFARKLRADDVLAQSRLLLKEAKIPYRSGRYAQAVRSILRGLRLVVMEDEDAARQRSELNALLAAVRSDQGKYAEAERLARAVVEQAERLGERRVLAHAYSILDFVYSQQGRFRDAVYSPLALAIHEERGDLYLQAEILNNMGTDAYFQGRWSEALNRYERARELRERVGDAEGAAVMTNNIAEILSDQGRLASAERMFQDVVRVFRGSRTGMMTGLAMSNLGRVASRSGRFDEARSWFDRAGVQLREVGDVGQELENDARVSELEVFAGKWDRAHELALEVAGRAEAFGGVAPQVPLLGRIEGFALVGLGKRVGGLEAFHRSVDAARSRDAFYDLALTLYAMSQLFADEPGAERWRIEGTARLNELDVITLPKVPISSTA